MTDGNVGNAAHHGESGDAMFDEHYFERRHDQYDNKASPIHELVEDTHSALPRSSPGSYIPWQLRRVTGYGVWRYLQFLSTRYFWFMIEYALRVTVIGILVPSIIIH